jgi:hypothetical protein
MSSRAYRRSDLQSRRRSAGTHALGVGEIPGNRLSWWGEAVSAGGALALAGSPSARPCSSTLVIWQEASTSAVYDILRNPAYAGAYVYGRKSLDPTRRTPAHPRSGRVLLPADRVGDVSAQCLSSLHYVGSISRQSGAITRELFELSRGITRRASQRTSEARKGWCAVAPVGPDCTCATRVERREFPVSICEPRPAPVWGTSLEGKCERSLWRRRRERRFLEALRPDQVTLAPLGTGPLGTRRVRSSPAVGAAPGASTRRRPAGGAEVTNG